MALPTRKIGKDQVSAIGFGAMGISIGYGAWYPERSSDKY
jgi:hypothetical protein